MKIPDSDSAFQFSSFQKIQVVSRVGAHAHVVTLPVFIEEYFG